MNLRSEAGRPGRLKALGGQIVREPIVHFLAIGLVLFFAAGAVNAAHRPVLRIEAGDVTQLTQYWELQMQRPPTKAELQGIIRERIDEEILATEAIRLGLDKDDMIIRRRLAQKMAFASEDTAPVPEPSEKELKAFYDKTKADYVKPAHMALRQIYFSDDRVTANAQEAAGQALWNLQHGKTDVTGDPFVLPLTYADVSVADLARDYGAGFARALMAAKVGDWTGPIQSEFGWHLVRLEARHPALAGTFEEVHTDVRDAWLLESRAKANAAYLAKLRRQYRVEMADGAK